MNQARNKYIRLTCIVMGVMILDQWTKAAVQHGMELSQSIPIIQNFFNLTYVRNPGAAFGILSQLEPSIRITFFMVTSIGAFIVLTYFYITSRVDDITTHAGLALLLGGAAGNFIDRVRYGEVVDFLDFYIGGYHWPAFNVADSAITIGIAILLLHGFWRQHDSPANPDDTAGGR